MTALTSDRVEFVFRDCLWPGGSPPDDAVIVEGITIKAAFDPVKVAAHQDDIREMLAELPGPFHAGKGGGWTFLNACNNRHGHQWTGFQRTMDELFMIGTAAGMVTCLLPREVWPGLPGGVPYYMVDCGTP